MMENKIFRESEHDHFMKLDNQLCFGLYATSHAIIRAYRPMLQELGLTYPQYLVLLALWERDGQTVSTLGANLFLDSGTLSPVLKRLEGSGLIVKSRQRHDERMVEIALTPKGQSLKAAGEAACSKIRAQTGMSVEAIETLRGQLDTLLATLTLTHDAAEALPLRGKTLAA